MDRKGFRKDVKKKGKSVYLIYEFLSEQGGLERELIIHSNFLKEEGYNVKILTCHLDKKLLTFLPFEGIKIEEISKIKTPYEWLNIILSLLGINNLKKYNPDLFISYSFLSNWLIRNKKQKRINYINHFPHFLYLSNKEKIEWANSTQGKKRWISVITSWFFGLFLKRLDKKLINKNDLNLTNRKFTKKRLDKLYGTNCKVSYPPLDIRFKPVKSKIKEQFVFSSSRIIPDKKYELLIKSMYYLKHKLPIYLAGSVEESYKKKLMDLAKLNRVNLNFLGRLNTEQIKQYYSSAAVFAFPTPGEDFGLVPAESLACGTPVIVWGDGAGPTEQVIDGVNGFYAKPINVRDFAAKIDKCIESKLKQRNRKKIIGSVKNFSYKEIKKDFLKDVNHIVYKS